MFNTIYLLSILTHIVYFLTFRTCLMKQRSSMVDESNMIGIQKHFKTTIHISDFKMIDCACELTWP